MLTRHIIAGIFFMLAGVFVLNALFELLAYDTDGIEIILNLGNGFIAFSFAMIFIAPDPDPYDRIKIDGDPHAPRDLSRHKRNNERYRH